MERFIKKMPVIVFLVLGVYVEAQNWYKYSIPKIINRCERGPDSMVNVYDDPAYPIQISSTRYTYDNLNRITSQTNYSGSRVTNKADFFFNQTSDGFSDSAISINQGEERSARMSIYNADGFLAYNVQYRSLFPNGGMEPYEESEFTCSSGSGITVVNGKTWRVTVTGPRYPGNKFYKAVIKGDVLLSDSFWQQYDNKSSRIIYRTYAADTIVSYDHDTSFYDSVGYTVNMDSMVSITRWVGDKKIVSKIHRQFSCENLEIYMDEISITIDTVFANGNRITYYFDKDKQKYFPIWKSKRSPNQNVSVTSRYVKNKWENAFRGERYYLDGENKCLGTGYTYEWINGIWDLYAKQSYYYDGQTADKTGAKNTPCGLPNPFSVSFPVNCEALIAGEPYTMRIFDLSGKKVLDEQFYVDQSIGELVMLQGGNLYYFVISNSQNEVISKQKILMGY